METTQQTPPDVFRANCLSRHVLGLIADQWTPLVIYALEEGTMRFSQLRKRIDGISYLTRNPFFRQPFCGMWELLKQSLYSR